MLFPSVDQFSTLVLNFDLGWAPLQEGSTMGECARACIVCNANFGYQVLLLPSVPSLIANLFLPPLARYSHASCLNTSCAGTCELFTTVLEIAMIRVEEPFPMEYSHFTRDARPFSCPPIPLHHGVRDCT
jgi:hypothetical protein